MIASSYISTISFFLTSHIKKTTQRYFVSPSSKYELLLKPLKSKRNKKFLYQLHFASLAFITRGKHFWKYISLIKTQSLTNKMKKKSFLYMAKLMKFKIEKWKYYLNDQIIFNSHVFCKTTFFFKYFKAIWKSFCEELKNKIEIIC